MGLLSDLDTVQWVMIGVPLAAVWVLLICGTHSNGKRAPWAGLALGPLFIPLLVFLAPFGLVALVVDGVKRRKPVQIVVAVVLSLLLAGYVAAIVALGDPPPLVPADLPVER